MDQQTQNLVTDFKSTQSSENALKLLKSLANRDRLKILCSLIESEKSVGQLETELQIRQPTLSQQLSRLRTDNMVKTRREGKVIFYSIDNCEAKNIIHQLHTMFCKELKEEASELEAIAEV